MTQETIMDAVGLLDDALIAEFLRLQEEYHARLQKVKRKRNIILRAVAACLALFVLLPYGLSYIPTEYDYPASSVPGHRYPLQGDYWCYYVTDSGIILRERVRMYGNYESRFDLWKKKNNIGDDVQMLEDYVTGYEYVYDETGDIVGVTYVNDPQLTHHVVISSNIKNYKHYEKKLKCLKWFMESETDTIYEIYLQ